MTSLFKTKFSNSLNLLGDLNHNKKPIFVVPTKYISVECTQAGYLLNTIYKRFFTENQKDIIYKNFFCNSQFEAIQGAIKVARHYHYKNYKERQGEILIYDSKKDLKGYFQLKADNVKISFMPKVEIADNYQELNYTLNSKPPIVACLIRLDTKLSVNQLKSIHNKCLKDDIVFIIDFSALTLDEIKKFLKSKTIGADLYIWGEQLTEYEIPFGVFSIADKIYKPWSNVKNCLLHSSTYSGNILTLTTVNKLLLKEFDWNPENLKTLKDIEESPQKKQELFSKYINTKLPNLYKLIGYNINISEAQGNIFKIKNNNEIIDCVSGGGLGIFGHNPTDLTKSVLLKHNSKHNYWKDLCDELTKITNFDKFIPAVSGATAVENAIKLGLVGQYPNRKKIIVFKNNYSGKLLLPIISSKSKIHNTDYFKPLYDDVITIDAFGENAGKNLTKAIKTGEIGLIWFEYIQGATGKKIPNDIINIIKNYHKEYNYYIGIDEILMGMHRTGPFFSFEETGISPDIITLSKGLTYMSFPIGLTLVTNNLYKQAINQSKDFVQTLETRYINQLASHIALHCLKRLQKEEIGNHVKETSKYMHDKLEYIKDKIPLIETIENQGLFAGINFKIPWWIKIFGNTGRTLYLISTTKYLTNIGLFVFFDNRLVPSLNITKENIDKLTDNLKKLSNVSPLKIMLSGLGKN